MKTEEIIQQIFFEPIDYRNSYKNICLQISGKEKTIFNKLIKHSNY